MPKRFGNNPKRRISPQHSISQQELQRFADEVRYLGSAHHKRVPADYGFHGPPSPRPHKSLCDSKRVIRRDEAKTLLLCGLKLGNGEHVSHEWLPQICLVSRSGRRALRG